MRFPRSAVLATASVLALLSASACGGDEGAGGAGGATKNVEVFTWWADGGEKAGLDGLVAAFGSQCADFAFVNGAVAGGAGANAKQVLASRLQQGDPPDTFQAHAGSELNDYIKAGQVEDLSARYQEWGLNQKLPKGLIDSLTVDGKIYSVPANIHRANVVWANKKVLADAGITANPTSLAEFFTALDAVKAKGVATPLALGKDWTQLMLFESVLISDLGPEKFNGLWKAGADWSGADVTKAIADYRKLLSYANTDRDSLDWTDAEKLVMDGKAAFQLMGDWAAADLDTKGFTGKYVDFVFPGNGTAFQWLADSFVLPKGAKNAAGTTCWLKTVGSAEGQKAFNAKKGSIPARTDVAPDGFSPYLQKTMKEWTTGTQVVSCAHGSACSQAMQGALNSAIGKFSTDTDAAALQQALQQASQQLNK